ncbi:MAG: CinA family protein [Maricaulaceae bacterium]
MNPLLKDIFTEAEHIVSKANASSIKIGTAESCTGGLVGAAITSISGSSACYMGGIISYANNVKIKQLNVPADMIKTHGAVSEPVALAMAEGARDALNLDIAISVTGIAGPGGGSAEKPVGLVYIALAHGLNVKVEKFNFGNIGRNEVRDHTSLQALKKLHIAVDTVMKQRL